MLERTAEQIIKNVKCIAQFYNKATSKAGFYGRDYGKVAYNKDYPGASPIIVYRLMSKLLAKKKNEMLDKFFQRAFGELGGKRLYRFLLNFSCAGTDAFNTGHL